MRENVRDCWPPACENHACGRRAAGGQRGANEGCLPSSALQQHEGKHRVAYSRGSGGVGFLVSR